MASPRADPVALWVKPEVQEARTADSAVASEAVSKAAATERRRAAGSAARATRSPSDGAAQGADVER